MQICTPETPCAAHKHNMQQSPCQSDNKEENMLAGTTSAKRERIPWNEKGLAPAVVPEGSPQNVLRSLGSDATHRKNTPIMTGVLDYFPLALAEVARISKAGNDQHNPGKPLHWSRGKSTDHADCIVRHLIERGTYDAEGTRHSAKVAWRALALLQTEIEEERGFKAA